MHVQNQTMSAGPLKVTNVSVPPVKAMPGTTRAAEVGVDANNVHTFEIEGLLLIEPKRHSDHRGFFAETYSVATFAKYGVHETFVQDNQSLSVEKGVLRGLHFQTAPMGQAKLLRVNRGSILDIAVDIRPGSATFGKHVAVVLSADNWRQFFIPAGFAHGFVTLETNTEVMYKVTQFYSPQHDRGLRFDDPALGIDWGITREDAILSDKDRNHPLLADLKL